MSDTKWGDPITVDGKRPEWLGQYEGPLGYKRSFGKTWFGPARIWSESDITKGDRSGWSSVTHIILPANHPYYLVAAVPLPADWAISHALDRTKNAEGRPSCTWTLAGVKSEHFHNMAWAVTIFELARMIEKYEPELAPVDPDVLAVREILAAAYKADGGDKDAEWYRDGTYDKEPSLVAALAAYRAARG